MQAVAQSHYHYYFPLAFCLLIRASPSVLRAAIMFTCLVIGNQFPQPNSAYNSLAASAFLLLCYDPRFCWDIGFQLSYAAVFSILLFMKPLYQTLFIKNKYLNYGWKLISVTLAAQILTLPISMYHFHQFPNLFLVTNLVAVPPVQPYLGNRISHLRICLHPPGRNRHWLAIEPIDPPPQLFYRNHEPATLYHYRRYTDQPTSGDPPLCHHLRICYLATTKKKLGIFTALGACWLFFILYAQSWYQANKQQKLIVYNVPQHQAIDFITGQAFVFKGDSLLINNPTLSNFHLKPSRTAHRIAPANSLSNLLQATNLFKFGNISLLLVDQAIPVLKPDHRIPIDIIILSRNPNISAKELTTLFDCRKIVIDPTNSHWKTRSWQQDCHKLGISCHAVTNQGAFVLTLH